MSAGAVMSDASQWRNYSSVYAEWRLAPAAAAAAAAVRQSDDLTYCDASCELAKLAASLRIVDLLVLCHYS